MPLLERSDHEGALVLTLNRPEKRNAINAALWEELHEALVAAREQHARCVVLAGAGKAFSAGGDVSEADGADDALYERIYGLTHRAIEALYMLPCPTIAMIHGATIGAGLELALACDFRIAGESSFFDIGFTRFAAPPEAISAAMLPRLLGLEQAKRWVFTGERWTGEQAMAKGLVGTLFSDEELREETMAFASKLASGPTVAYGMGKKLMNQSYERSVEDTITATLHDGLASMKTRDAAEAIQAMIERREPNFSGS